MCSSLLQNILFINLFLITENVPKVNVQLVKTTSPMVLLVMIVPVNVVFATFAPITQPLKNVILSARTELPNVPKLAIREKPFV